LTQWRLPDDWREQVDRLDPGELPRMIGDLEHMKAAAWARLMAPTAGGKPNEDDNRLVDVREAARYLSLPIGGVYELARQGRLPSRKVGKYRRFKIAELRMWLDNELDIMSNPPHDGPTGPRRPQASRTHTGSLR
jgi:excisionase family DNA binding protein